MNLTVSIPDKLATRLSQDGTDLGRQALEALVLEGVRAGRMTTADVREALDLDAPGQADEFLQAHGVSEPVDLAEAIRRRFAPLGGVELELPPRPPMREPPTFG